MRPPRVINRSKAAETQRLARPSKAMPITLSKDGPALSIKLEDIGSSKLEDIGSRMHFSQKFMVRGWSWIKSVARRMLAKQKNKGPYNDL